MHALGRWCHDRRARVLAAWAVLLVALGGLVAASGSAFTTRYAPPDVESSRGLALLAGSDQTGQRGTLVLAATEPFSPDVRARLTAWLDDVARLEHVASITSPFSPAGATQVAPGGTLAYATVDVAYDATLEQVLELVEAMRAIEPALPGVAIEYGGQLFASFSPPESETLGLAFAVLILVLAFGSVLAMGLPILTALGGIASGTALVALASHVVEMPDSTGTLGVMIGLGVGIDYALFIVTRYRDELRTGVSPTDAVATATATAGRAVLFAAATVVISLLGMLTMQVSFVRGLALGSALTVATTAAASVTLLPALLGFAAGRIERTRVRGLVAASLTAAALAGVGLHQRWLLWALPAAVLVVALGHLVAPLHRELTPRASRPLERTLPWRWSRLVQRSPWRSFALGTAVLVVLAIPVFSLRLGFADEGNYPASTTTKRAYDLLAAGFGPGFNGPLTLVQDVTGDPAALERAGAVTEALGSAGAATVAGPFPNANPPTALVWQVIPQTGPQDLATEQLVHTLRNDVLPRVAPATTGPDASSVLVTGQTAVGIDFTEYLAARLWVLFAVVLALSFLLLMVVFRSVLVPAKAVVMNLVSIAAAYGVVVAVFQWGWLGGLLNVRPGPIEPFVPMMLFAIVFGLSMDYEVFLLSRIRERWLETGENATSVADGVAQTARVITAAAAIMVFVFGSFLLEPNRTIQLFGLGLAVAVAIDATVVRLLLVPATMELLGERNWWLPAWLDRVLPRFDVEGSTHADKSRSARLHPAGQHER
jgi:RND superfamily putative drug exporter